jgi:glycosyltransferase involved in cell wall biosynthesis
LEKNAGCMRIAIVSCVYPPEPVVSAQTSAQLVQSLFQDGHDVTVITSFPNRPGGKLYAGYKRRLFYRETHPYGKLIRCGGTFSRKSRLASRFIENITFGITSACALAFTSRVDVIYSNTWPLFATGLVSLAANLRGIPLVVSIQDVYPESLLIQKRVHSDNWWVRVLRAIDTWIVHHSQAVVVISEGFANIYREERKLPAEQLFVIPNWGNEQAVIECDRENPIRSSHQFTPEHFVFGFGGNIGMAAGVDVIIRAMKHIDTHKSIKLLIAGDGSQLSACKQLADKGGHHNITFHSPWPEEETSSVLGTADVLILPTSGNQTAVSVPSKLINYLLSARPVLALANSDTEIAEIIQKAGCGWVIPPDQPEVLAEQMIQISTISSEQLVAFGRAGRQYALDHFNKEKNIAQLKNVLYQSAM